MARSRFRASGTTAAIVIGLLLFGAARPAPVAQGSRVRIALVNVPDDVLRPLLTPFHDQTGMVGDIVYTGQDPYDLARRGGADIVISHYGHEGVEPFVTAGFGLWPHPVFANQMALLGPAADPAHVRGLTDAAEALRRIAATKSPFVVNTGAGASYVEGILWTSAGDPPRGDWYLNLKSEGRDAVRAADQKGAYVLFGIAPFLRLKREGALKLEPLVTADSLLQRIMVSVVVNPAKVAGANVDGAKALERFLLSPPVQARIRAFRYPDFDQQVWWPAGRHNSSAD
jgi:tungstate transport system substrate-binding protein